MIEGGNYDVDMTLISPADSIIRSVQKQQYDQHTWTTDMAGTYQFCFSNEFSTITHKIVYFDFRAGDEDSIQSVSRPPLTAMTQVAKIINIHQFYLGLGQIDVLH